MGQSVMEDVSPEARLARGISATAVRVTVYHPDCISKSQVHQEIALIGQVGRVGRATVQKFHN